MTEQNNRPTDAQLAQDLRKGALGGAGGRILEILGGIAVAVGLAAGVLLPVILAGAVLIGLGGWIRQKTKGAAGQRAIDAILPDVVNAALEQVQLDPKPRLLDPEAANIPLPSHDGCSCSGYIRGTYRGLTAELCTVRLTEKHEIQREETGQWETNETEVYAGQWMLCQLGQELPTWLTLWPREALDKLFRSSTVQTGEEAFDKRFQLNCGDAQAALRMLDPTRMERLLALADRAHGKYSLSLHPDGRLYVAVSCGRGFFSMGKERETPELLRQRFSGELKWFTDMIDAFRPA